MPELVEDLDNCMINFDRKVVVTNLLDEYGGQLEEIAKTVNDFLTAEEEKGKKYLKTFLLRGLQPDSEDEVITLVPADKLKQREQQLRNTHSLLYSAETDGGSKSPPTEFVPLKHITIKLDSLEVKPAKAASAVANGTSVATNGVKDEKPAAAKKTGALGAMFKKQETAAAAAEKKSPEKNSTKKEEKPSGSLGAMFKKQESTAATAAKKSPESSVKKEEKPSGSLGAMFKKQEAKKETAKKSPETEKTKKSEASSKKSPKESKSVLKPPTPKKMNDFFKKGDAKKPKLDPNVSVNLFEESSSSEDEEALDAIKREVLSDDEEEKPTTSGKRRRIIDSDDEDIGPEVKIERKDEEPETVEVEDDTANESATFMDEDGFVVTVKAKNKRPPPKSRPALAPVTVKIKKESPTTPQKTETAASKTPAAKKKQGNIMSFFKKK